MPKSKAKGNSFEIKLSKALSTWMFNNRDILWREPTSGGRKIIYNGDIIPANLEEFPWKTWPFIIEAKYGYKQFIPTFLNFNKVKYWLNKLLNERTEIQYIPLLICQFHAHSPILITNQILNHFCELSIILDYNTEYLPFYIYNFKSLLEQPFIDVFGNEFCNNIQQES